MPGCSPFAARRVLPLAWTLLTISVIAPRAAAQCEGAWRTGPEYGAAGVEVQIEDYTAYATTTFDDGTGPALYVGGRLTLAGHVPARAVARWRAGQWEAVGTGAFTGAGDRIYDFTTYRNELVAGGGFYYFSDGRYVQAVARWNAGAGCPLATV